MTFNGQSTATLTRDAELRRFVEDSFASMCKKKRLLRQLSRKPHDYHSSFELELLDATFADGSKVQMILKDLGSTGILQQASKIRPNMHRNASREIEVYQNVLADASLDTAVCYGAVNQKGRTWLLLEKVDGDELYQIGDFEIWRDAARWLATMHKRLNSAALKVSGHSLIRYDEQYWNYWIDRAEAFLERKRTAGQVAIDSSQLRFLARQSRKAAQSFRGNTFIHGEFYPSNIIVRESGAARICPIDWETAGIGLGALDLAALSTGNWSAAEREVLCATYFDEFSDGFIRQDFERFVGGVCACRLLLAMKWLGWFGDSQPPAEHRFDWLQEAIRTADELNSIEYENETT